MADKIPLADALKEPELVERIEHMIGLMRLGLAPLFNAESDDLPMNQSLAMTAAALLAGMVAGHMLAFGALDEKDKKRASQMVLANFRNGIELGKREVRAAMLRQLPAEGSA